MDPIAQLAMMSRAKLLFETPNTFLSFPALTPLSYSADSLKFGGAGVDYETLAEFARFTNVIPKGTLYQPTMEAGAYLWDVYQEIFTSGADLAQSTATQQETAAYEQAMAFLYTTGDGGLRTDSPALVAYKQYRDAHILAQEEYKNAQLTAIMSTDAAVKSRWETIEEPALRQKVSQASADWESKGDKTRIEEAMQTEISWAARSPVRKWEEWRTSFDPNLDMIHDAATTGFSPGDVFDHTDWPTFKLSSTEITQLIAQAPPELRNVLGSNAATSNIDSISFEFRSVTLNRSWYRPAVFDARFWRLPGSEPLISDGGSPPSGKCPAYITALVFARNIIVGTKKEGTTDVEISKVATLPVLQLQNAQLKSFLVSDMSRQVAIARPVAISTVAKPSPQLAVTRLSAVRFEAAPTVTRGASAMAAAIRINPVVLTQRPPIIAQPKPSPPPPPSPSPTPPPAAATKDISILAFICKRVTRCPNPDPSLAW